MGRLFSGHTLLAGRLLLGAGRERLLLVVLLQAGLALVLAVGLLASEGSVGGQGVHFKL